MMEFKEMQLKLNISNYIIAPEELILGLVVSFKIWEISNSDHIDTFLFCNDSWQ